MRATGLRSRGRGGFSLIELMIVIAIVGILFALAMSGLSSARCKGSKAAVTGAISTCESTIAGWSSGSVQSILDCLKEAQDAIDKMVSHEEWWDKGKSKVKLAVNGINTLVDELITRVDNQANKDALGKAKLITP